MVTICTSSGVLLTCLARTYVMHCILHRCFVEKQFVTSIFTTGGYYLRFGVALDHVIALSKTFVNKMEKNRYTLSKKLSHKHTMCFSSKCKT